MEFRKLKAQEIDCRIGMIRSTGLQLLLYKDARVDMNLLDESGCKWKKSYELIGERLYCTVSIYDDSLNEWIGRQDVGTESYTEKEKGQASDAFKRACVNWGIGRELYSAPFIWVPASKCNITASADGKRVTCSDKFTVESIAYDESGNISEIRIRGAKGVAYEYPRSEEHAAYAAQNADRTAGQRSERNTQTNEVVLRITQELVRTGVGRNNVLNSYGVKGFEELDDGQLKEICEKLRAMPDKPGMISNKQKAELLVQLGRVGISAESLACGFGVKTIDQMTELQAARAIEQLKDKPSANSGFEPVQEALPF